MEKSNKRKFSLMIKVNINSDRVVMIVCILERMWWEEPFACVPFLPKLPNPSPSMRKNIRKHQEIK